MGCGCLVSLSCAHIRWYDTTLCYSFKYGIFHIYWIKHRDFFKFSRINSVCSAYVRTRRWQFVDRCPTWGSRWVYRSYRNVMSLFLLNVNSKMLHCAKKQRLFITFGNWLLICNILWFPVLPWWMNRVTSGFFTIKLKSFVHYYNVADCRICSFIVRTHHFRHFSTYKQVKFRRPVRQSICLLVWLHSCSCCTCCKTKQSTPQAETTLLPFSHLFSNML